MATIYDNLQGGTITDNPLTSGATTINSAAFASLPAVTAPDILYITLDPEGANGAPEIVEVTAHTASATSLTVVRARQGTTARSHPTSTVWVHALTEVDIQSFLKQVVTANIVDSNVTTAKIADGAVTDVKLASNAVTTAKILDSNVTTAKIADSNVTTAKIADANVTDVKLASNAVTTAKILDGNVTEAKLASALLEKVLFIDDNKITWTANATFNSSATNVTVNYAKYQYITAGRVHGELEITLAGTPGAGGFEFDLPVTMVGRHAGSKAAIGQATLLDSGSNWYHGFVIASSTTKGQVLLGSGAHDALRYNAPFTWAVNDKIHLTFEYPIS